MQISSEISDLQRNIILNPKSKRKVQKKGKLLRLKMYNCGTTNNGILACFE